MSGYGFMRSASSEVVAVQVLAIEVLAAAVGALTFTTVGRLFADGAVRTETGAGVSVSAIWASARRPRSDS